MGEYFTDRFSKFHFASGFIFCLLGIPFSTSFIAHLVFEAIENEDFAIRITRELSWWPGGKRSKDTILNSLGDQVYFTLGWLISKYINRN